jgi:biopolymer transport protein ExbD
MLKLAEAERPPRARFEMTPIMDVVFLLIVFFLYALVRMHVSTAVEVELPEATENGKDAARDVLVLTLAEGGGVWVGDEAAADDAAAVGMLAAGELPRAVLLRCDKAVPVGRALEMLSRLERAGIGDVAFETARPAAEPAGAGSEK